MKTQAELKAHYRDVIIPMVAKYNYDHKTDVKPWECVRSTISPNLRYTDHPVFDDPRDDAYTFAITILDGKPVFVGDKLFNKVQNRDTVVHELDDHRRIVEENYTWTPPPKKRTFLLNGVELPCPDKNKGGYQISLISSRHFFSDFHDAQKVANAIDAILTEARDKEE